MTPERLKQLREQANVYSKLGVYGADRKWAAMLREAVAEIERLQSAIAEAVDLVGTLPNIDEDADPLDTSPEDACAHVGGLLLKVLNTKGGE